MGTLKWLSNIRDPRDPNWGMYVTRMTGQTHAEACASWIDWVRRNVIGDPQAADAYTVEELKRMGLVGLYARESDDD